MIFYLEKTKDDLYKKTIESLVSSKDLQNDVKAFLNNYGIKISELKSINNSIEVSYNNYSIDINKES